MASVSWAEGARQEGNCRPSVPCFLTELLKSAFIASSPIHQRRAGGCHRSAGSVRGRTGWRLGRTAFPSLERANPCGQRFENLAALIAEDSGELRS